MHAQVGDELIVKGNHVGDPDRKGRIREVRGAGGEPPFVVEWDDHPGGAVVWPGSDAFVKHLSGAGDGARN